MVEWLHVRALQLHDSPPASTASPPASSAAAAADSGHCFEVQLADGRVLVIRADTPTQRALWAREILRLASYPTRAEPTPH